MNTVRNKQQAWVFDAARRQHRGFRPYPRADAINGRDFEALKRRPSFISIDAGYGGVQQNAHVGRFGSNELRPEAHDIQFVDARAGELPEEGFEQARIKRGLGRSHPHQFPQTVVITIGPQVEHFGGAIEIGIKRLKPKGPPRVWDPISHGEVDVIEWETAYIGHLRTVDALAHVVRAFEDPAIPHVGPIDPLRDVKNVEFDLMVSDLGQIEKRLERVEKDLKKMRSADLEKEFELLQRAKSHLETDRPLREMEMTPEDKKRLRGFMFLSEKPLLCVLNVNESSELGQDLENAAAKYQLTGVATAAICGKVEAELAEMSDADAAEFLSSYGLKESGLVRLIRTTYALMGLISFFTAGEDECRAWTIPVHTRAEADHDGRPAERPG